MHGFNYSAVAGVLPLIKKMCPNALDAEWCEVQTKEGVYLFGDELSKIGKVTVEGRIVGDRITIKGGASGVVVRRGDFFRVAPVIPVVGSQPTTEDVILRVPEDAASEMYLRLLDFARGGDTSIAVTTGSEGRVIYFKAANPPRYLVLKATENRDSGIRVFVAQPGTRTYIEYGYTHPFAEKLSTDGERVLIGAGGFLETLPQSLQFSVAYDHADVTVPAKMSGINPSPKGDFKVPVSLTLRDGPTMNGEVWFFDRTGMLALEELFETLSPEDLDTLSLARGHDGSQDVTFLRETVRPNTARLAERISAYIRNRGFCRTQGLENLLVQTGKRLVPGLRTNDLRDIFQVSEAQMVLVYDDPAHGQRVASVPKLEWQTARRWVEYLATSFREEYDRLENGFAFDWPSYTAETEVAEQPMPKGRPMMGAKPAPKPVVVKMKAPKVADAPRDISVAPERDEAALIKVRDLETYLMTGGVYDRWAELAQAYATVGDTANAEACAISAIFFDGPTREMAELLTVGADPVTVLGSRNPSPRDMAGLARAIFLENIDDTNTLVLSFPREIETRFVSGMDTVSRRLAWAVLHTLAKVTGDSIQMTRFRETVLGDVMSRGLRENLDIPPAILSRLAMDADENAGTSAENTLATGRTDVLAALYEVAKGLPPSPDAPKSLPDYIHVIFQTGFAKLGVVREPVTVPPRDTINGTLTALYEARAQHFLASGGPDTWRTRSEELCASVTGRARDRVRWLTQRSAWLRTDGLAKTEVAIRDAYKSVSASFATNNATSIAAKLAKVLDASDAYEYEREFLSTNGLHAMVARGNDESLREVLAVVNKNWEKRYQHPTYLFSVIGAVIRASAVLGDTELLTQMIGLIETSMGRLKVADINTSDFLMCVKPLILAMRKMGSIGAARNVLGILENVSQTARGGLRLTIAAAEGYALLGDTTTADRLVMDALDILVSNNATPALTSDVRSDAAMEMVEYLRYRDNATRERIASRILLNIHLFRDGFTATTQGIFETRKVIILETIVDMVTDGVTRRRAAVSKFLDAEEFVTRDVILENWRTACGT